MIDVPNLDAMDEDELLKFTQQHFARSRALAQLYAYAERKRFAMIFRRQGDIEKALSYERKCDETYQQIPAEYRW